MKPLDRDVLHAGATPRRRSRWWLVPKTLLPLLVLAAAAYGARYFISTRPDLPVRPVREQVYVITTTPAIRATHRPKITVYGEIVAGRRVDLRALVAGEIVAVNPGLKPGAIVEAGEELVSIDRFEYRGAVTEARAALTEARAKIVESNARIALEKAALASAREQLEIALRDLRRAERLEASGAMAARALDDRRLLVSQRRQNVDQHLNTLAIERSRLEQQNAALERLRWRLAEAERRLENTVLKAPFRAVIRTENAQKGRLVGVNDVLASLYDVDRIEVRFSLSDRQFGRIAAETGSIEGRPVEIRWHLGDTLARYSGTIDRIGAEVVSARGGIDLFARVEKRPGQPALRPGTFVEVVLDDRAYEGVFALPETALYNGDHVFVVVDDRLQRRAVKVLAYDGDRVLVSGDIAPGAPVLTTRIAEIGEGLKVREAEPPAMVDGSLRGESAATGPTGDRRGGTP